MDKETLFFRIDAYTPATLPMWRMAEYLLQLSMLYGSRESVHFNKVTKGSAVLQASVEGTESELVVHRVRSASREDAPEDAKRAYYRIDSMLRENHASGEIKRKTGRKILIFPGRKLPEIRRIAVTEYAEVDGIIVRVGGTDNTIPVHLQGENDITYPCQVRNREMAREMAALLYGEPIRVRGPGQWERSPQGEWKLLTMTIEGWEVLDAEPFNSIIERLRANPQNGWRKIKDPNKELRRIRDGE